jgi:hypothetical protein
VYFVNNVPYSEEYLRVLAYPKFDLSESDFLLNHEILPHFKPTTVKAGKPENTHCGESF